MENLEPLVEKDLLHLKVELMFSICDHFFKIITDIKQYFNKNKYYKYSITYFPNDSVIKI